MKRFLSWVITALFLTTLFGCMGGGTIGTGITPMGFGSRKIKDGVSFLLIGRVRSPNQKPITAAEVTLETSTGVVTRKTDAQGEFRAPITIQSGEYIHITVFHGKARYQSEQQLSPAGAREVIQNMIIDTSGAMQFE